MVYLTVSEAKISKAEVMAQGFNSVLWCFYKQLVTKQLVQPQTVQDLSAVV
jgi:hypothetical protein